MKISKTLMKCREIKINHLSAWILFRIQLNCLISLASTKKKMTSRISLTDQLYFSPLDLLMKDGWNQSNRKMGFHYASKTMPTETKNMLDFYCLKVLKWYFFISFSSQTHFLLEPSTIMYQNNDSPSFSLFKNWNWSYTITSSII